jgi:feruloyl esterase
MRVKLLACAALVAAAAAVSPAALAADAAACDALTRAGLFPKTTVSSARVVAADAALKLPSYCEITAVVSPVPESRIGVVYRLPDSWNGKMLGLGGGGWAGNITLTIAAPGLQRGYATAQTDGGHPGTGLRDTSWANDVTITDFSSRAVHEMTVVGKEIVAKHYGKPQSRSYFHGCSTGGRQGLIEVQRFPGDYDGVIAGAPVYSLVTQSSALVRNQLFAREGARLTPAQLTRLNQASTAACDELDGLKDGIVTDPRACNFDPAAVQCQGGADSETCLSPAQTAVIRAAYAGVRNSKGEVVSPPLTRGGEAGWARFIAVVAPPTGSSSSGIDGLRRAMFGNADFDLDAFDAERDFRIMRDSDFAQRYEAKDPDISAFVNRGGRLLLWHGWDDAGPSPFATIDYFESLRSVTGPKVKSLDDHVRLFLAPGVYHCRDGPGPDQLDLLGTLDTWVENGRAPQTMLATKADSPVSRPLCAFPAIARYRGTGNPNDPVNFSCR